MGTNDNRDRKLAHHEKPIWQHAFKESMKHTSVEGAERNAWKAVDICYRVGMFHEDNSANQPTRNSEVDSDVWRLLIDWFEALPASYDLDLDRLIDAMTAYSSGKSTYVQFKEDLREMFDGSE